MVSLDIPMEALAGLSPAQQKRLLAQILRRAREATPVRTGRLRDGWYLDGTTLRNDVPYAEFVNDGTPRMAPRGMTEYALGALG